MEEVKSFKYVKAIITSKGSSTEEIKQEFTLQHGVIGLEKQPHHNNLATATSPQQPHHNN